MVTEPIPKRSDVAKGVRTVYLNRVAHMGMMLDKMNRQNRRVERIEKFAATGKLEDLESPEEDEDMGVNIGNEIHYHYEGGEQQEALTPAPIPAPVPPPATPTPTPTTDDQVEKVVLKILSKLKKIKQETQAPKPTPIVQTTRIINQGRPAWQNALMVGGLLFAGGAGTVAINYLMSDEPSPVPTPPPVEAPADTDTWTETNFPK